MSNDYTIDRVKGIASFMNAEDWSVRLPETAEWCYVVAEERGIDFDSVFPELSWLKNYKGKGINIETV